MVCQRVCEIRGTTFRKEHIRKEGHREQGADVWVGVGMELDFSYSSRYVVNKAGAPYQILQDIIAF